MTKESKILIGVLVGVVAIMVGIFVLSNSGSTPPLPTGDKTKVVRDTSHSTGSGSIQMVEFGDYQCPACGAAEPNVQKLLDDPAYAGKITFYFRNFPLVNIHANANAGANAAEAAADQGKFWEMHNLLYARQSEWTIKADPTDTFVVYAKELGIDESKFKSAIVEKKFQSVIDQDVADATALGVNSTPTFYFNGVKYDGKATYDELKAKVDSLIAASTPAASATPSATPAP